MNIMTLIAGGEVLLLVVNLALIRKNEGLLAELRRCNNDLALALCLATQARFREAEAAAREWANRMRAYKAGVPYEQPKYDDGWRGRFAP